jgi:hypothetical protein
MLCEEQDHKYSIEYQVVNSKKKTIIQHRGAEISETTEKEEFLALRATLTGHPRQGPREAQ